MNTPSDTTLEELNALHTRLHNERLAMLPDGIECIGRAARRIVAEWPAEQREHFAQLGNSTRLVMERIVTLRGGQ